MGGICLCLYLYPVVIKVDFLFLLLHNINRDDFEEANIMYVVSSAKMSKRHQQRLREAHPEHEFHFFDNISYITEDFMANVEILATYGEDLTPAIIDKMPRLKWIHVLSAGLELMPFEPIAERDILVTNARGIHRIQMSEYTLGMILNLVRRSYDFYEQQKRSEWNRDIRVGEAFGKTVGIVGFGAIGDAIAERAKAFGMRVLAMKRTTTNKPNYVDELYTPDQKIEMLRHSDFVVVILPHTPETTHFIGEDELNEMKSSAYLINIARGKIVDSEELLRSVREQKIAGAVLDVFDEEPLPSDHPFWKEENIILTPHVSGRSPNYMQRAVDIFMDNLKEYPNNDQMINVIDPKRGY